MSQMSAEDQKRIRALPGNGTCVDCDNINPQWASVSYGTLMCLECSGQHRSIGVHLSFVRSLAMDSWTEKQLMAMEKSGGNQKTVDYFQSRGIKQSLNVATKYNTKQAEYLRNRLARWLEGRTEPPPDPGNFDPVTGVSDAQGAEAMKGETTEQYNERQARLRDAARERMRAKFGDGGMGGIGAGGSVMYDGSGGGGGGGDGLTDKIGGALGGLGSFFKEKVVDNETLRGAVGGVISKTGQVAGGAYNSLKESERFGGAIGKVGGAVGGIVGKAGQQLGVTGGGTPTPANFEGRSNAEVEKDFWNSMYQKPGTPGSDTTSASSNSSFGSAGEIHKAVSAPTMSTRSSTGKVGAVKAIKATDDDWGDWGDGFGSPKAQERERAKTCSELTKEATPEPEPQMSMSLNGSPAKSESNGSNGYSSPSPTPAPAPKQQLASDLMKKPPSVDLSSPAPKAKAAAKLATADDFFADFGM